MPPNILHPDSHILAVYVGNRGYYFEQQVSFDPAHGRSILGDSIRNAQTPEDIYHNLIRKRFQPPVHQVRLIQQNRQ